MEYSPLSSSTPCSLRRSFTILLPVLLLICRIAAGEISVVDTNASTSELKTCSASSGDEASCRNANATEATTAAAALEKNSWFFDSFMDAYKHTVDLVVGMQMTNWNYLPRYHHFDESSVEGMCEDIFRNHLSTGIPKFEQQRRKAEEATEKEEPPSSGGQEQQQQPFGDYGWELPADFRHDSVADIDGYLKQLAEECSADIDHTTVDRYETECLDRLKAIVYEPKCTTRFDSRLECDGSDTIPNKLKSPSQLVREHFGSSASDNNNNGEKPLHVVIIGAGPIGLMLGNALAMLHKREPESVPPIKILFVETRADAPGVKKPYSRNWQAHLNLRHFRYGIDPRLVKIYGAMTDYKDELETSTGNFVFPLNIIETTLLLSNKDLGAAKFLFGVNPLDLVEELEKVPNLVLVDATGHRLEPLRRGSHCDGYEGSEDDVNDGAACFQQEDTVHPKYRTPAQPEIPWEDEENESFYNLATFKLDFTKFGYHEFLEAHGQYLHVGRSGDILYPVDEKTHKAKTMWWLDIHGAMPMTQDDNNKEKELETDGLYASKGPVCEWCEEWFDEHPEVYEPDFKPKSWTQSKLIHRCNDLCYAQYYAQSTTLLRKQIVRNIFNGRFNDTFVYHSDSWFPLNGYSFNPSPALAHVAIKVLAEHGMQYHPIGMPLGTFVPAILEKIKAESTLLPATDFELLEGFKRYSTQMNTTKWPTVTLFTQQPFIYANGVKTKNKCLGKASTNIGDHLEHAPMIRFGDSFTIGDGLNGAGFYTHASMIGMFMDAILYHSEDDDEEED